MMMTRHLRLCRLWAQLRIVAVLLLGVPVCAQIPRQIRPFTVDEARPLLQVLSKLGHVKVVDGSPHLKLGWPYICWLDDGSHSYPLPLQKYPGRGLWLLTSDLPRICLMVQPDLRKGESPFVISSAELEKAGKKKVAAEVAKMADRMNAMNTPTPWRDNPYVDPDEFRADVVAEIPKLAAYLDGQEPFKEKASLGVEVSHENLDLPGMEDRDGDSEECMLVSDLKRFSSANGMRGPYDRALHFWVNSADESKLYGALVRISGSDEIAERDWPMLYRVAQSQYGAEFTQEEVELLQNELGRFRKGHADIGLNDAMDILASICKSAKAYNLAIYVPGE